MTFSALTAVGTLVFTFVNFLTYIFGKPMNVNGIVTQLIAWAAGIAAIFIASATQLAPQVSFGSEKLSTMDFWTKLFIGLIATSILSTVNEVKKAIDSNDTARKNPIVPKPAAQQAAGAQVAAAAQAAAIRGEAQLGAGGAVTVTNPGVQPNSLIQLTAMGNQQGNLRVTNRQAGSFTIASSNADDVGPVAYEVWPAE